MLCCHLPACVSWLIVILKSLNEVLNNASLCAILVSCAGDQLPWASHWLGTQTV